MPALLVLASCGEAGASQQAPSNLLSEQSVPDGPVVDAANILPAAVEAQLNQRLRDYWRTERTALVVASIEDLEDKSIDQMAIDLFNRWGIGSSATDRGLLILVAPNQRQVRIEVGCGLEAIITNAVAKDIIEQTMIPLFRGGDYSGAVAAGIDELTKALAGSENAHPTSSMGSEQMKEAA